MIRYGVPLWLGELPKRRRPSYPRYRGDSQVEVVIVGGGFTGCATAYAFAAAGIPPLVLEAGELAGFATAASTGFLMQEPEVDFLAVEAACGRRAARRIWEMSRRGMLDLVATLKRLNVQCRLQPQDSIYFTTRPEHAKRLRREQVARREAGLDASWLTADRLRRDSRLQGAGGIKVRGNAQIDPYRAAIGLAAAAAARGARICVHSPVQRIRYDRRGVDIRVAGGTIRARRVILATGVAGPLFASLARHLRVQHTYAVATPPLPAPVRAELGSREAMLWDTEQPYHYLRWARDDRIVFGGADQPRVPERLRPRALVQRTGQLMYELSLLYPVISGIPPQYGWDGLIVTTADGVPYIGPHRNYPHHLFATGYGGNGLAGGFLASRILLRHHLGEPAKGDELFGFTRGQ